MSLNGESSDRVLELTIQGRDLEVLSKCGADIQAESGCCVEYQVKLSGSADQVQKAKDALDGVLCGEAVKDIFARQAGAEIIKNASEEVQDYIQEHREALEKEHKLKLSLVGSSIHVISNDPSMADEARERIEEALEHLTEVVSESILLPGHVSQSMVSQVKNDLTFRQLIDGSGLQESVVKDKQGTSISLRGLSQAVLEAKALLSKLVEQPCVESVSLCPGLLAQVSEPMAADMQRDFACLAEETGVAIELQWECNRVSLKGDAEAAITSKFKLMPILSYYFPGEIASVWLPPELEAVQKEIGRLLLSRIGPLAVDWDKASDNIWFSGDAEAVRHAKEQMMQRLQQLGLYERLEKLKMTSEAGKRLRELQSWAVVPVPAGKLADIQKQEKRVEFEVCDDTVWAFGETSAVEKVCEEFFAVSNDESTETQPCLAWVTLENPETITIVGGERAVKRAKREVIRLCPGSGDADSESRLDTEMPQSN